jgi:hypothetical protein
MRQRQDEAQHNQRVRFVKQRQEDFDLYRDEN